MGRRQLRYCILCRGTHKRPTGIKCKRTAELEALKSQVLGETSSESDEAVGHVDGAAAAVIPQETEGDGIPQDNIRMARMEALMDRIASIVLKKSPAEEPGKGAAGDGFETDRSSSSRSSSRSCHGRRRSCQNRIFS